jgi:hypothetical protein
MQIKQLAPEIDRCRRAVHQTMALQLLLQSTDRENAASQTKYEQNEMAFANDREVKMLITGEDRALLTRRKRVSIDG